MANVSKRQQPIKEQITKVYIYNKRYVYNSIILIIKLFKSVGGIEVDDCTV